MAETHDTSAPQSAQPLDCGHPESPHGPHTTGYGTDASGRRSCYECCTAWDLAELAKSKPGEPAHFYYLSSDGASVTNWPGSVLARVTRENSTRVGGFGGMQRRTYIRAVTPDGKVFSGSGPGRGMFVRLRAVKARS